MYRYYNAESMSITFACFSLHPNVFMFICSYIDYYKNLLVGLLVD
jgi:hypothetical protein